MIEILLSLIVTSGSIIVAVIQTRNKNKLLKQSKNLKNEISFSKSSLDFGLFLKDWAYLYNEITDLLENTEIDRFLILRAWNGSFDPKWTSAVMQIRQGEQEPVSYVHFELDKDYVNRLRLLDDNSLNYFKVEEIEDSAIKSVYEAEGVKASVWGLIGKQETEKGSAAITYCSYSTHNKEGISKETRPKCDE